jgi:hypothetical protein
MKRNEELLSFDKYIEREKKIGYFPQSVTVFRGEFMISPVPVIDGLDIVGFNFAGMYPNNTKLLLKNSEKFITVDFYSGIIKLEPNNDLRPGFYDIDIEAVVAGEKEALPEKNLFKRVFSIRVLP